MDKIGMTGVVRPIQKTGKAPKRVFSDTLRKENDFKKVLDKEFSRGEVKFSAHAQERLRLRDIELSKSELDKINQAVAKAASKGAKETLIVLDERALVVSVKNNTVITVMDQTQMKENVFTNIDSAVIL